MNAHETRPRRILLVEDEALIALAEKMSLEKHGYDVVMVHSGESAIETVDSDPGITLVLMDIDLGEGPDGTEAAERILETHDIPIAFLSSHTEPEVVEKTEGITSYGYIVKNSGETVLVTSVKMAFRLYDAHMELKRQKEHLGAALTSYEQTAEELSEKTEEAVEREAMYRNLMENSIDGVELLDEEGNFLNVNRRECEMTGYSKEELLQMSIADIDPNYPADGFDRFWKEKPTGGSILFETVHRHKDGTLIPVEVNGISFEVNGKRYLYGVARDIRERRQLEERLRESEENFRFLAEHVQDVVWLRHVGNEFPTYVSPSIEKVLGYTPQEALSLRAENLHTRESYARQKAIFDELVDRGLTTSGPVEHEVIHKDGHTVPIEVNPTLIWDEAGKPTAVVSVVRDISDRKEVEALLEADRSLLRNVLRNAPGGLFVKDRESRFITANSTALAALGVDTVDEIIGRTDFDFFSQEFAEKTYAAEKEIIATGDPVINEERPDIGQSGARRWLLVSKFPFIDEKSGTVKGVIGTWHDITENRRQRDRLETALEEKQLLMRELNHRVKNNLLLVSSLIDLKDSILGSGIDLSDVRNQVDAIAKVHELLQASDDISHMSLKSLVADILSSVFHSSASRNVTIQSDIPDISVRTRIAVSLGLIVNEIATNALQHGFTAEEGGYFTVALEEDPDTTQYVLTISNTGPPFPEDKDIEKPRGLGLQLVSALVEQLEGTLELQREPHPRFTIRFCGK